MARKRKSHKRTHRRSRRMSGIGKTDIMSILAITAGAAAGRIVTQKVMPNMNSTLKSAGVLALGAFILPKFIKGKFGSALGTGMVAAGGMGILQGTGLIGAIEDSIDSAVDSISGFQDIGAIQDVGYINQDDSMESDESMGAMDEDVEDY
tara:strand:+ start:734 stop:1183 length:450 start_codon:yes stop_codon:yes gene_type:complete